MAINTDNYSIGQVSIYFEASPGHASLLATNPAVASGLGGAFRTTGRDLGNIVTSAITPDVTFVEHFISDCGKKKKDKVSANMVNLTIPFTFDEINFNNLKRFFLASQLSTTKMAPLEEPLKEGAAQIVFKTDVGQDMTYFIPKCTIRPDGDISINDEDWWSAPLVLDVLYYSSGSWASKPYGMVLASAIDCS